VKRSREYAIGKPDDHDDVFDDLISRSYSPSVESFFRSKWNVPERSLIVTRNVFFITLALIIVTATSAYHPLLLGIPFWVMFPLIVVFWKPSTRFEKLKLHTLLVGKIVLIVAVLSVIPKSFAATLLLWLLRLNIFEAMC
jgi:hypothetical protein